MSDADVLSRARVLLQKITPGPWVAFKRTVSVGLDHNGHGSAATFVKRGNAWEGGQIYALFAPPTTTDPRTPELDPDAVFIAAAPELVRALLQRVEMLERELDDVAELRDKL